LHCYPAGGADVSFGSRPAIRVAQHSQEPRVHAITVLTLAIGIGANAALFSVVDALLLRPLPYPDADGIVTLSTQPDGSRTNVSPADFLDYRDQNRVFEHIGALSQVDFNVIIAGVADRLTGFRITSGFLETLGVRPLLGRPFTSADDQPGAPRLSS
jgi:putative ABC transport system permease protein